MEIFVAVRRTPWVSKMKVVIGHYPYEMLKMVNQGEDFCRSTQDPSSIKDNSVPVKKRREDSGCWSKRVLVYNVWEAKCRECVTCVQFSHMEKTYLLVRGRIFLNAMATYPRKVLREWLTTSHKHLTDEYDALSILNFRKARSGDEAPYWSYPLFSPFQILIAVFGCESAQHSKDRQWLRS